MKLSKLIIAASLLAVSATSVATMAHEHDAHRHMGKARLPLMHMLKGLDLTDAQHDQIKVLVQQQRADVASDDGHKPDMEKMRALFTADHFDEAAARALLQQHQQQTLERKLAMLKLQYDIRQLLTPEQREALDKKREYRRERRHPDA